MDEYIQLQRSDPTNADQRIRKLAIAGFFSRLLDVYRRFIGGHSGPIDFQGTYLDIRGGQPVGTPIQSPYPPIWVGGSSDVAIDLAAKHGDVYASWAEPLDKQGAHIATFRAAAAKYGRKVETAMTVHVVVRDTEQQAWAEVDNMLQYANQDAVDALQRGLRAGQSVGQERASALHGGKLPKHARDLEIAPNVWAGYGLLRVGSSITLVGTPAQVAARLIEYHNIGVDKFILSHHPLPEEALRVADDLLPLLPLSPVNPQREAAQRTARTFNNQLNGVGVR